MPKSSKFIDTEKKINISVSISGDADIKKLNKKFFKRDYPTDVLSFNLNQQLADGTLYLGDIIVNRDQAKRQAAQYNNDLEHEISALIEHGVLHLLGVHHDDDDENSIHGVSPVIKKR